MLYEEEPHPIAFDDHQHVLYWETISLMFDKESREVISNLTEGDRLVVVGRISAGGHSIVLDHCEVVRIIRRERSDTIFATYTVS